MSARLVNCVVRMLKGPDYEVAAFLRAGVTDGESTPAKRLCHHQLRHMEASRPGQRDSFRSRRAFDITDSELNVIAALAIIGLITKPKKGYSTPAATGTPSTL